MTDEKQRESQKKAEELFISILADEKEPIDYAGIDLELLVYLKSRGTIDIGTHISRVIQTWKKIIDRIIKDVAKIKYATNVDTGEKRKIGNAIPLDETQLIEKWPSTVLDDFWGYCRRDESLLITGTILRAVEWCDIGGFQKWWDRYAKEFLTGPSISCPEDDERIDTALFLLSMTRSDFAIQLLNPGLPEYLSIYQYGKSYSSAPWELQSHKKTGAFDRIPLVAAAFIFAAYRIHNSRIDNALLDKACDFLLSCQSNSGAWPFDVSDSSGGIIETAAAIHALWIAKPRGWEYAIKNAKPWLISQQLDNGLWYQQGIPDIWLTVLVLDAIELAEGGNKVTFKILDNQAPAETPMEGIGEQQKSRLELDEPKLSIRIDDKWHVIKGPRQWAMVKLLMDAKGGWIQGKTIGGRPRQYIMGLPKPVAKIINSDRPGFQIDPSYFS